MTKEIKPSKPKDNENVMRKIRVDKVVLSISTTGDNLEKGVKLLKFLTGKNPAKMKSTKRIPDWGVRPNLEVGTVVTIRKGASDLLKRILSAVENTLRKKQMSENCFTFGLKEYIEIPGVEYQRDIGIMGFDVTVVFKRSGRRVGLRKIGRGKIPKKQIISKEEIIKFMEENFNVNFI